MDANSNAIWIWLGLGFVLFLLVGLLLGALFDSVVAGFFVLAALLGGVAFALSRMAD